MTNRPFIFSFFVLTASIAATLAVAARGTPVVVKTNLEKIPMQLIDYQATEDYFPEAVYKELDADKHIYRHYRSSDGRQIDLYIGYYGTSKGGRTPHNPFACFSGAGWAITDSGTIDLNTSQNAAVNYFFTNKSGTYQVVFHWYQRADKIISDGWKMNLDRFRGLLFHNRNDGAFVRISVATDQQHLKEATNLAKAFTAQVVTLLPTYWPEER